ncbi:RES domain-containing protein [Ruegeria faecimaris]|uniref:RES domain-containing protein n=1 Tax=Ruegeria faecimaris TaxID=686389 RepID=UPI00232B8620|nr:RES domain-containing protein [Ruegeria faecimaris]
MEKNIFPILTRTEGQCSFCKANSENLVSPRDLGDYFELLVSAYEEDEESDKRITDWLREDWLLFDCPDLEQHATSALLAEILDDGEIVRKSYRPARPSEFTGFANWETLKDELRYKNRFFLDEGLNEDRLRELLDHLISEPLPEQWYRARIMAGDAPFELSHMGAPPKGLASHGRANPPGIPYLYLASKPNTGIAEVRPHTGEKACVAMFSIPAEISVVDLRKPKKLVSPFLLQGTSDIAQLRADIPFLEKLGEELTRPVLPRSAAIDYVPSQFLCEFIKKQGFSGVLYSSSVSDGMNLALFDIEAAEAVSVAEYLIDKVSVDISPNTL